MAGSGGVFDVHVPTLHAGARNLGADATAVGTAGAGGAEAATSAAGACGPGSFAAALSAYAASHTYSTSTVRLVLGAGGATLDANATRYGGDDALASGGLGVAGDGFAGPAAATPVLGAAATPRPGRG